MSKRMPKQIYIWKENEGESEEYLATAEHQVEAAPEPGGIRRVGVYVLKEMVEISSEVKLKSKKVTSS